MPDGFAKGEGTLPAIADSMVSTNETLQDNARQLAQAVDSVQGAWSGAAAQSFTNLMEAYGRDFKTMNDSLYQIAEQIQSSEQDYNRQEEEAAADVSAITATLDNG
jgi:WXG100 family type VII secretion target